MTLCASALILLSSSAFARNERVPPPRTYVSSGGLGDGEPWLLTGDDPYGGGGGAGGGGTGGGGAGGGTGGGGTGGGNMGGTGGGSVGSGGPWNWWNDMEFWGWGSGWWRYEDPVWPNGGGEGTGGGEGGSDGCGRGLGGGNLDRAMWGCRIIVTGGDDNGCDCREEALRDPNTGEILWRAGCYDCVMAPAQPHPECRGKNPGEEC